MSCNNYLKLYILCAAVLLLCGCPQGATERPNKGRWGSQDTTESTEQDSTQHAGSPTPAGTAGKSGSTQDKEPAADEAADETAEQPCSNDDADETIPEADDDATEDEAAPVEPPAEEARPEPEAKPAAPAGTDLSGEWLPLFGRGPQGVKPELWKSGKLVLLSGNERALVIKSVGGGALSPGAADSTLKDVRLVRSGPFLIVDQGNNGRTAYLNAGSPESELASAGKISGRIAGEQFSGTYKLGQNGLKLELDNGTKFDGKAAGGAWCGFLEAGRRRGYCVLTMTGKGSLAGILFVDPYMSFETDLSFEVMQ